MAEITALEEKTYAAGFWDDPAQAQELMTQLTRKRELIKGYQQTAAAYDDAEAACRRDRRARELYTAKHRRRADSGGQG